MEPMQWLELIDPEILFLVAFIYVIGVFLKSIEKLDNKFIPLCLWVIAIVISIFYYFIDGGLLVSQIIFNGLVQGTFVAGVAVFGNQMVKQLLAKP